MKKDDGRLFMEDQLYSLNRGELRFSKASVERRDVILKLSERVGKQIEQIFAKKSDLKISK